MKKPYSYIGILLVVLIFGILFIPKIVERIQGREVVDMDRHQVDHSNSKAKELIVIGKAPAFQFTNQHGKTISEKEYAGSVYVVEFFFTTCPSICPIMNRNLVQLQYEFRNNPYFGIASFTINPEHDTRKVLKEYAEAYHITHTRWHLLTGDREKIYQLANTGFNLYAGENNKAAGGFEHSGLFALIDKKGNIRCRKDNNGNPIIYYDGTEAEGIRMLKADIAKLLKE
jgi:protein SCO1/2